MTSNYPKLGLYAGFSFRYDASYPVTPLGYPFLSVDLATIDQAIVDLHARWDLLTIDMAPSMLRPDVLTALRTANPSINILAFGGFTSTYWNSGHSMDPTNDIAGKISTEVLALGAPYGYVRSRQYLDHFNNVTNQTRPISAFSPVDMNLTNPAVIDVLVRYWGQAIASGLYDGLFFDYAQHDMSSSGGSAPANRATVPSTWDNIDYAYAGFVSEIAFRLAYKAGHQELFRRLRAMAPAGFFIVINDGGFSDPVENPYLNGLMRENFPSQSGGTWAKNMHTNVSGGTTYPGMLSNDIELLAPPQNWLNMLPGTYAVTTVPTGYIFLAAPNLRQGRFGLGSATLGEGIFTMSLNNRPIDDLRWQVWFPEYSVDLTTMVPTGDARCKGWLGAALGRAYQVTANIWRRDFEHGSVLVNSHFSSSDTAALGETLARINDPDSDVNIGGNVTSVTIAANDAIFLGRSTKRNQLKHHRH